MKINWDLIKFTFKQKDGMKIKLGLIWMSGKEAGIYAIVRIENDPILMTEFEAERKYWYDTSEKIEAIRVEMTISKRLVNRPLFKKNLIAIEGLQGLSILRQYQGTNFPVKLSEWRIIFNFI